MIDEQLIRKKTVYRGRYVRVEERCVRLADGTEALREIVVPPNAVGVLLIDADKNVHLVKQYRQAISRVSLEIPAGVVDPGEGPEEAALRECAEETGWCPRQIDFLFTYYHSVGFSTGNITLYVGQDPVATPYTHTDPGEFIERVVMPFDTLYQMCVGGQIVDSKTLLATLWYQQQGREI